MTVQSTIGINCLEVTDGIIFRLENVITIIGWEFIDHSMHVLAYNEISVIVFGTSRWSWMTLHYGMFVFC